MRHEGAKEGLGPDINTLEQPCCTRDEGRPLAAGVQAQAANHLKLRRLRAGVVSVEEKAERDSVRYGPRRRA